MYRNIEDIEKEMDKRIAETGAFLEAWRNVTFPTKKDGTPFKNMSKNFKGAKFVPNPYAMQAHENTLEIYACTRNTGYNKDFLLRNCKVYEQQRQADTQAGKPCTEGFNAESDLYL